MPDMIEVEMKDSKSVVRLEPVEILVTDQRDTAFKRKQFPLILAYALTIHKAQGATISRGVIHVNFQTRVKPRGAFYVALSRFPTRDSFVLMD